MIPPLGTFWTAANVLSLLRVGLAIPITALIVVAEPEPTAQDGPIFAPQELLWILALILLAALSDWFDGRVARWSRTVSNWGKVLDPLCDKAAILLICLALALQGLLPLWFLGVIALRDVLIILGSVLLTKRISEVKMSLWWGKAAATAMAVTILAAVLEADPPVMQWCVWLTVALMLLSYSFYTLRYIRLWRAAKL